ncbi:MAG: hypothetical protein QNJ70_30750 [Xenococcaceae cyanobacterium MO_207.B15]|nr:hypothetical protein [Xenococcaceae cyanobacterium MO_207.B15]
MVNLPAQAEWEYTRWGMSVDEVVAASEGAAIPVNLDEQILLKTDTQQTLLKSQWSKDGYSFNVFFNFSINRVNDYQLSEIIFKSTGNNEDLGLAMIEEFGLPSRAQGGLSKKDSDIRGFRLVERDNYAVPETEDIWRNQPERTDEDIVVLLEWNTARNFIQMSRQGTDDVIIRVKPAKRR